jgi:hypothetical protein
MTWRETTKLTPSLALNWKGTKIGGVQRNFFSNPGKSTGIGLLWHLPGRNAPARNPKNAKKTASVAERR